MKTSGIKLKIQSIITKDKYIPIWKDFGDIANIWLKRVCMRLGYCKLIDPGLFFKEIQLLADIVWLRIGFPSIIKLINQMVPKCRIQNWQEGEEREEKRKAFNWELLQYLNVGKWPSCYCMQVIRQKSIAHSSMHSEAKKYTRNLITLLYAHILI